jgi:hypothetical protein
VIDSDEEEVGCGYSHRYLIRMFRFFVYELTFVRPRKVITKQEHPEPPKKVSLYRTHPSGSCFLTITRRLQLAHIITYILYSKPSPKHYKYVVSLLDFPPIATDYLIPKTQTAHNSPSKSAIRTHLSLKPRETSYKVCSNTTVFV